MVGNIFNHLVTALDIIPDTSIINICTNHPSTCVITGKIRIISKRPFAYKSLVLTAKGVSCVMSRQGPKSYKAKQVFLEATKDIVHESSHQRSRRDSLSPLSSPIHGPLEVSNDLDSASIALNSAPRDSSSSNNSNNSSGGSISHQSPLPVESSQLTAEQHTASEVMSVTAQNQIEEGVNDIDFRIEFPSHQGSISHQQTGSDSTLYCLPTGPTKIGAGRSTITYTLNAALVVSRKHILVNNQLSVSVPFHVQTWQDMIDWNQSEDSSYHGKRRNKIEFQFQVPKQLDSRRLHDLQFGFSGRWKTLQDHLKVAEVQYYIIEEELQEAIPVVNTTIISTSATHDCTSYNVSTNDWDQLRSATRLQIFQPNTVLETIALPWPHSLTISHKLRVVIRFDQTHSKERQLQLSFPIQIYPTLSANGSPVHPELFYNSHSRNRRRIGRSLYGANSQPEEGDSEDLDDEDDHPLPIYGDREDSLLLMVEQEVQEAGLQVDALGISMGINFLDQGLLRSPSETSFISSSPNSPNSIGSSDSSMFPFVNGFVQEEPHAWGSLHHRSVSLTPVSSSNPVNLLPGTRRHSSIEHISNLLYPPPYILPTLNEEQTETAAYMNTSPVTDGQDEDLGQNVESISGVQRGVDERENVHDNSEAFTTRSTAEPTLLSIPISLPTPPYEA
ncbi:hypothetical protein BGX27_009579 [Mortierella sp. AM989]|nr:hypothetical protein BGX27_009579 [Mortierella sp. AM989]